MNYEMNYSQEVEGRESWNSILVFCFFLVKTFFLRKSNPTLFVKLLTFKRSQLYEIIIDYLLILAKVTLKQCAGAILICKWFSNTISKMRVKCEPNNFWIASCESVDLWAVCYNSTRLWVGSCEFIIRMWVGIFINLHYISLHYFKSVWKKIKSNKVTWYIPIMIYTWEQP